MRTFFSVLVVSGATVAGVGLGALGAGFVGSVAVGAACLVGAASGFALSHRGARGWGLFGFLALVVGTSSIVVAGPACDLFVDPAARAAALCAFGVGVPLAVVLSLSVAVRVFGSEPRPVSP